jgi:hypothetical protein
MSAIKKLEERLSAVEAELAAIKEFNAATKKEEPWWKEWMGAFQDDPYFEEAMKLGRAWRRGKKPNTRKKKASSK